MIGEDLVARIYDLTLTPYHRRLREAERYCTCATEGIPGANWKHIGARITIRNDCPLHGKATRERVASFRERGGKP